MKTREGQWCTRMSQRDAVGAIARGDNFEASAMCGYALNDATWVPVGQAYGEALRRFKENQSRVRYVVKSYATPIAWKLDDGTWEVPAEKYSRTTSKHQSLTARGVQKSCEDGGMVIHIR
jgi:hypothetical protein